MRSIEDSFSEIKTRAKPNKKPNNFIERNVFSIKTDFGKKKPEENLIRDNRTVSINSFLSEMSSAPKFRIVADSVPLVIVVSKVESDMINADELCKVTI
ncbi:MAG: hypothetical protein EOP00_17780 [Pedobacter sp.]|nr:MAG: hypothetical protein EOP00_17780 [Pedobacter sp.]